jgi:hypothetical protein
MGFELLVFGIFTEMRYNVKDVVETTIKYGVKHLGTSMAAMPSDLVRMARRRSYKAHLSLVA